MPSTPPPPPPGALAPDQRMLQMLAGHYITQCISVAARLRVPDHLASGPKGAEELARLTGAQAVHLYRLLRALAALGVLEEHADQRFTLTPLGATLRSGPGSLAPVAAMLGDHVYWDAVGELLANVKEGIPGVRKAHGAGLFDTLRTDATSAAYFDEAMTTYSTYDARGVTQAYDFGAVHRLVDVGGGQGHLLRAILKAFPKLHGTLFDQAHNIEAARKRFEAEGLAGRADFAAGDFFQQVPTGAEVYTLANVLQDWSDERAVGILSTIRAALKPGARLLVVEIIIPPGTGPSMGKLVDITNMIAGGRTRTQDEHARLLAQAGLRLERVIATPASVHLLEAVPA